MYSISAALSSSRSLLPFYTTTPSFSQPRLVCHLSPATLNSAARFPFSFFYFVSASSHCHSLNPHSFNTLIDLTRSINHAPSTASQQSETYTTTTLLIRQQSLGLHSLTHSLLCHLATRVSSYSPPSPRVPSKSFSSPPSPSTPWRTLLRPGLTAPSLSSRTSQAGLASARGKLPRSMPGTSGRSLETSSRGSPVRSIWRILCST